MIVYLDTNAFDHIYKKIGCTSADVANLRKALYGRQLSIRLSLHTLEEILLGRKVAPQALAAQIKLTLSLASARMLVKPCAQLLLDDIRAYAARGDADRPYLLGDAQNAVADGIAALIESDGEELEEDFVSVLHQARQEKPAFLAALEQARHQAQSIAGPRSGWTDFEQYFGAAALPALEALAEWAGVAASCGRRGLDGLLETKSVRMSLRAALGPGFVNDTTDAPESSTLHHLVSAAAVAEAFVSDLAANRDLVRMPIEGLSLVTLPAFLQELN